jgi:uncharacterized protein (DUF2141 family)
MKKLSVSVAAMAALAIGGSAFAGNIISNDLSRCNAGKGPAVKVVVTGIKAGTGKIRVQSYNATKAEWLAKGKWLSRIELRPSVGSMTFCVPVPKSGNYGIAVRHDLNGNGKTDITSDGGGMSRNPSISIFNLGKPSVSKVSFFVDGVTPITINMKYR